MNATLSNMNKATIKTYDLVADTWETKRQYYLEPLKEYLTSRPKTSLLDLGCGTGRHLKLAKELGFKELLGVDASKKLLEKAKNYAEVKQADISTFESNQKFDTIICIAAFHHLLSPESQLKSLKHIKNMLNEELFLTVWTPSKEYMLRHPKKMLMQENNTFTATFQHEGIKYQRDYYYFKEKELKELLIKAGFSVQKTFNYKDNMCIIAK